MAKRPTQSGVGFRPKSAFASTPSHRPKPIIGHDLPLLRQRPDHLTQLIDSHRHLVQRMQDTTDRTLNDDRIMIL